MILTIAWKELKEILRERRFVVLAGAMLILLVISVFISRSYYQSVKAQHEQASATERNVWVSQGDKNPHSAAHYGTYAFKPRYPLSLVDQGVDKYSGVAVYLEAHRRSESQYMAAQDQTGLSRFGELTPDFALLYLFPLFIVLIGFNAFTREKESGTIKLLKSQGVSLFTVAMGKWAGIMLAISAVFLPVFVLTFFLLNSLSDFGELNLGALGLVFLIYLIYYMVFVNVSLLGSAFAKNSNVAFVCLLTFWITACLAIPKLSTNLASGIFPYPSQREFEEKVAADEQKGLNGHEPWSDAAKKLEAETLAQDGVAKVEDLPVNFDGLLMQKGEEHSAEIYFKHYDLLRAQYRKQAGVYQATSLFSPFLPARFLSMAICGTDYDAHWEFSDAAEQYRIKMMETLNIHFANNSKYGDWDYLADKSLWAEIPPFSFQPATLSSVMGRNSGHIAILFLWVLGTFALLYYASKHVKTAL